MEITDNQNKAVDDIVEMVVTVIGNGSREVDTTEAISSMARLAGSFLFRSFEFEMSDVKPGTVMLSQEANIKGPQLVSITHAVLHNMGVQINESRMTDGNQLKAENSFIDIIHKIQRPALEIMKRNKLNYEQMAQSAAIATAFIIQQSSNISPEQGFGSAVYYYIEGTKTAPPAFEGEHHENSQDQAKVEDGTLPKNTSKPWWKFW